MLAARGLYAGPSGCSGRIASVLDPPFGLSLLVGRLGGWNACRNFKTTLLYRSGDPFPTPWDKSSSNWPGDVLRLDPAVQEGRTDASPEERAVKPDPRSQFDLEATRFY